MRNRVRCPICPAAEARSFRRIEGYDYFECKTCSSLFLDPDVLAGLDQGQALVAYDQSYWQMELAAAKERSFGSSLARVAEAFLYCRRPIKRFIDIGTGPGYLLDALAVHLPHATDIFYGLEAFPPQEHSTRKNYLKGMLSDLSLKFDGGSCIEVIEHLTPRMAARLIAELAGVSEPNAFYLFNSGLPAYVKSEDPGYLDPLVRGHVASYSLDAVQAMARPCGFVVHPIPGKSWAYGLEYLGGEAKSALPDRDITHRIWSPCPENAATLKDPDTGSLMYILGIETARAYRVP